MKPAVLSLVAAVSTVAFVAAAQTHPVSFTVDPLTRDIHITYRMPENAPDETLVTCSWAPTGTEDWRPAKVTPLLSETALALATSADWRMWTEQGIIIERRAAGLDRTVVFKPYPEAQQDGRVDVSFRIGICTALSLPALASYEVQITADNSDITNLEDWTQVLQRGAVATEAAEGAQCTVAADNPASAGATLGTALYGNAGTDAPLAQLTYPLDLKGDYAVFVCTTPGVGAIDLRLTGDERTDSLASRRPGEEVLWRWTRLDRQHLVLKQPYAYTGYSPATVDYVKFVPLTEDQVAALDAQFGAPDKVVAGYWEPYSWAFHENVQTTLQHRQPLSAFAEARITIVDTQLGRFGMKSVFETRETDQLLYATQGDPIGNVLNPQTDNVGRMQQYTNTLDATIRYTRELGTTMHANFGASNCYPGSPLQGDFSKEHPDWMRGSALQFEVPEVRAYAMALFREALEIGAPGLSIDFCRYPETVDTVETGNTFMRELRALADEFAAERGAPVPILVRFPGTGVRRHELFDYATWAREALIDYLCPSNIQGRHMHIDIAPYLEAVAGTECKLLPSVDALSWGLPLPGPFLWRVAQLYGQGVPGIHVYQADGRILGRPNERRCIRRLASSEGVAQFWADDAALRTKASKGIYITPADRPEGYHGYERVRIWLEGVPFGPMEVYLDDALVSQFDGPPYLVGTEDYASDKVIPTGDHTLRIRAKDGDGWLDQTFAIKGG